MKIPQNIDLIEYVQFIGKQESQSLEFANTWSDELYEMLENPPELTGAVLPWTKTHNLIRLKTGEVSIWAGMNGHKKSMILGQVMAWIAREHRVCIASLEMAPINTLKRMCNQIAGCEVAPDYARKILQWADDKIVIYNERDTIEVERIIGMIAYAANEMGCKHIMVDSLTKCGLDEGDYSAEKKFLNRLHWAAETFNCHIHLVCHVRKPPTGGEEYRPNKFDIRGAGAITDLADNVFICWRNKAKERVKQYEALGLPISDKDREQLDKPDQILTLCKQRDSEWEGDIALWFDSASMQFMGDDSGRKIPFSLDDRSSETQTN